MPKRGVSSASPRSNSRNRDAVHNSREEKSLLEGNVQRDVAKSVEDQIATERDSIRARIQRRHSLLFFSAFLTGLIGVIPFLPPAWVLLTPEVINFWKAALPFAASLCTLYANQITTAYEESEEAFRLLRERAEVMYRDHL